MISPDCQPMYKGETVMEIIGGPDRSGNYTFFLYWLDGYLTGTRGQIFLCDPRTKKHDRVVDARKWPRTYSNVQAERP